jgi:hypothetical protein
MLLEALRRITSFRLAPRGIGFQPMVAVRRDIDRYSDRNSKSEAIFLSDTEDRFALVESASPMLANTRVHRLKACVTARAGNPLRQA